MNADLIRQELESWIKAQREALPERREAWAHGAAETLHDLRRELDRVFGPQNATRELCACGWSDEDHDPAEHQPSPHPCGHWPMVRGCGGCDPMAVEYELDEQGRRVTRPAIYCETCYGNHGWTGHHGVWEPCPKCGAA